MNLRKLLACASAYIEPSVEHAISATFDACSSPYKGLPVPIRFRASGALQAWVTVLDTLPGLASARHALSDPSQSPNHATDELVRALWPHLQASDDLAMAMRELIRGMLHISADMLCFWLRQGALYEPTLPLGSLLGGVDVAADLPVGLIQLPCPTVTILPPWQHRHLCGDAQAITIYQHTPVAQQAPATRCLSIRCIEIDPNAGALLDKITLAVADEQMPLSQALNQRFKGPMDQYSVQAFEGEDMAQWEDRWRKITEYAVKVLLYLQVQDAQVQWHTPHRDAPKIFPGLGRKKREAIPSFCLSFSSTCGWSSLWPSTSLVFANWVAWPPGMIGLPIMAGMREPGGCACTGPWPMACGGDVSASYGVKVPRQCAGHC